MPIAIIDVEIKQINEWIKQTRMLEQAAKWKLETSINTKNNH